MNGVTYVNRNGELVVETTRWFKVCSLVSGITATELWCDAYDRNIQLGTELLFPASECPIFEVSEHAECRKTFVEKGGGFRLDFVWHF